MIHDEVLPTNRDADIDTDDARGTGAVTFEYSANVLCITLNFERVGEHSVVASSTLSNTQLPVGTYLMTAGYSGDAIFNGSTSNSVGLTLLAAESGRNGNGEGHANGDNHGDNHGDHGAGFGGFGGGHGSSGRGHEFGR